MKIFLSIAVLIMFTLTSNSQRPNPDFDPELAGRLGGDERGMKNYILVILKSGTNNEQDSVRRAALFAGHFSNMNKLASEGKLIVAGPLDRNEQSYRGIFILDVSSFDEARKVLDGDPTIREKIFEAQYFTWYGSAALPEYLKADKKIHKTLP